MQGLMSCGLFYLELCGVGFSVRNMLVDMIRFWAQNKNYQLRLLICLVGAGTRRVLVVNNIDFCMVEKHWVKTTTHVEPKFQTKLNHCGQFKCSENSHMWRLCIYALY